MKFNFKDIHIGHVISDLFEEKEIEVDRALKFLKIDAKELQEIFTSKNIDAELLLRFSKLLEYDFFRIYSQHLVLYAPPASQNYKTTSTTSKKAPHFKKNVYTKEIITFIVGLIQSNQKTASEVIEEYRIPKTTLYKWLKKYQ